MAKAQPKRKRDVKTITVNPKLRAWIEAWGRENGEENFSRLVDRAIEALRDQQEAKHGPKRHTRDPKPPTKPAAPRKPAGRDGRDGGQGRGRE